MTKYVCHELSNLRMVEFGNSALFGVWYGIFDVEALLKEVYSTDIVREIVPLRNVIARYLEGDQASSEPLPINVVVDARQNEDCQLKEFIPILRKHGPSNIILGSYTFLYATEDSSQISYNIWKKYFFCPRWRTENDGEGWNSWLLPHLAERLGKDGEKLLRLPLDLNPDENISTIERLEGLIDEVWRRKIMPRLQDLARLESDCGEFHAPDPNLLLVRLARFLPGLKNGIAGLKPGWRQIDEYGPHSIYSFSGLKNRSEVILLLEGFLAPAYDDERGMTDLRIPHPVIAYRIAKELREPFPCQHTNSFLDFIKHYDLAAYRSTPGRGMKR